MMIDINFEQRVDVPGKGEFRIRMLRPDDKARLTAGFEQLSAESRYQRFFVVKNNLTESDLKRMTEFDPVDQVGLGVFRLVGDSDGECIAGGRIVRNPDQPEVGEVGLSVVDHMQHLGLGKILIELLIEAGRERGIERLRFDLMAENKPMRNLVKQLAPDTRFENVGNQLSAELSITAPEAAEPESSQLVALLCAMWRIALPSAGRSAPTAEPGASG